jgi:hypothetical protein
VAEPSGAADDRIEHRLHVGLRVRDGAQDLAGGGLLLQGLGHLPVRLGQRPVLLLQLGEEAHVLDGDDRLVREGLEQADLLVRERDRLGPSELDGADRDAFADQGYAQYRAEA